MLSTPAARKRLGGNTRGLRAWESATLEAPGRPTITVTATPCRHGPPLSRPITGEATGFALTWPGQQYDALWMTGDTVLYPGLRSVPERVQVGTTLLHLGGVRFPVSGPVRYTMTAQQGVELCTLVKAHTVLPVHYEGWQHFRHGRPIIEREFARAPEEIRRSLHWLPIGEPTDVTI